MVRTLKQFFYTLKSLIYPNICVVCHNTIYDNNISLCKFCYAKIVPSNFHLEKNNLSYKLLFGKVDVQEIFSCFVYQKNNSISKLMHHFKYQYNKELGLWMGKEMGKIILHTHWHQTIDYIIPLPLHAKREYQRGFNQADILALGIQEIINKPIKKNIIQRIKNNKKQASTNNITERQNNVKNIFQLTKNAMLYENKNILLIDDVLTTGSTISSCISELNKIKGINVYVVTYAIALN